MKTKPPSNLKQLVVRVPVEVHRAIKVNAAEKGRSVAVIVEGLIREYLVRGALNDDEVRIGGRNRKVVAMLKDVCMDGDAVGRADLPGGGIVLRGKAKKVKGQEAERGRP